MIGHAFRAYGRLSLACRILIPLAILSVICSIAAIFVFMPVGFTSDDAFYLLLARDQLQSLSLFPEGMCYSTELFVLSPNLLMVPFMAFIPDWITVRSIGIALFWLIILFSFYRAFCVKGDRMVTAFLACCILSCILPFGSDVIIQLFKEGGYLSYCLWTVVCLAIAHYALVNWHRLEELCAKGGQHIKLLPFSAGIVCTIALSNLGGIRGLILYALPFVLSFPLLTLAEGDHLDTLFHSRLYRVIVAAFFAGSALAVVGHHILSSIYWPSQNQMNLAFQNWSQFGDNVSAYFEALFGLYGAGSEAALTTMGGIANALCYFYATLCIFVFPIWGLIKINSLRNRFSKYVVLFCWTSNIILFAVSVPTGAVCTTPRYLLTTYFVNGILASVVLEHLFARRTHLEATCLAIAICGYVCVVTGYYWHESIPIKEADTTHQELVSYLSQQDLDYGYATFWNAYANTCYANGSIEFLAFDVISPTDDPQDPRKVFRWLTNEKRYDPNYHPGRCFILLEEGEAIPQEWYDRAEQTLSFQDYTILVYDKNINHY